MCTDIEKMEEYAKGRVTTGKRYDNDFRMYYVPKVAGKFVVYDGEFDFETKEAALECGRKFKKHMINELKKAR